MDYKNVIKDFNNGTIDKNRVTLVMDNDGGYWSSNNDDEEYCNKLKLKYGEPEGYKDIVDILNAAGVNCEWC